MEKLIIVLCVVALAVTATDGAVETLNVEVPGITTEEEPTNGEISTVEKVTIPEREIKEIVHYDHLMKFEFYWENKSSGEYWLWALDVTGQELLKLPGTIQKPDGFGAEHTVLYQRRELAAQFTLIMDESGEEPVTATGKYDLQRDEYKDLVERRQILTDTNANISAEDLPSFDAPVSFYGFMRSFYDLEEDVPETLEESVIGDDRVIELGDTGEFNDEAQGWPIEFTWVAERGEIIGGYETLFINATTDLGDENFSVPLSQSLWLADGVSVPVKQYTRTYLGYEGENETFYMLIENTFSLQEKGFRAGTQPIPWGECYGEHWYTMHPLAETDYWEENYMPKSGTGFDDSSFDFKTEEATDFLMGNLEGYDEPASPDLMSFLTDYPDAIVYSADYNASKDLTDLDGKAGYYWWNLSFGHEREWGEEWGSDSQYRYTVLVQKETTIERYLPTKEYKDTYSLLWDSGPRNGSSPVSASDISSRVVTMKSSEDIFKSDERVVDSFYTTLAGIEKEELDWGEGDETKYTLGASSGEQGFGMDLIGSLTGIQTVTTVKYYWSVEQEDLMEGGAYSSATLDAETGRLVNLMEIKGTALQEALKRD